ncbi:acyltransferase [Vibrio fluvialis]|nr:acyltransferase [Vibrio fluvialis]
MKRLAKKIIALLFKYKIILDKVIDQCYGLAYLDIIKNKGRKCRFEGRGIIHRADLVKLGDHVSIGRNFFIRAGGNIEIGSYTHISRNVTIHSINHNISGSLLPYDRNDICRDVIIGKYVWIGMNVQILPGVHIGDGAVIGMGTVVSKDVSAGEVIVGSSFRVIRHRDNQHTEELIANKKFLT